MRKSDMAFDQLLSLHKRLPAQADLNEPRLRDDKFEIKIKEIIEGVGRWTRNEMDRIALEQTAAVNDKTAEERRHDILRKQTDFLIRVGAAAPEDFEGLIWPPSWPLD
jgi:hypothetical protein